MHELHPLFLLVQDEAVGQLILLLLKHGADPNSSDKCGWSLLHHAAWNGDLHFIQVCVRHGKGDIGARNVDGNMLVDLATLKGHICVMQYLDAQSCDLGSMCRGVIRQSLGKKCGQLNKCLLPTRVKLFLNYNIPYPGFSAVLVPPTPWTPQQLYQKEVEKDDLREFIKTHASQDFILEHASKLGKDADTAGILEVAGKEVVATNLEPKESISSEEELVSLFQEMYLWEAFKSVDYEEPLARPPRYPLKKASS